MSLARGVIEAWPPAHHILLSPHPDDVVLSCGGLIATAARRGEAVAVITLFAATPEFAPESPIVHELHRRWGDSAALKREILSDLAAVRRAEDRRSLDALDPAIMLIHLPLADCIYRVDADGSALYATEDSLWRPPDPADPAVAALSAAPELPPGATLYAPLAIGGHVDHRLARQAVERWPIRREQVRCYEDYPYVLNSGALEEALNSQEDWRSETILLNEAALQAKINAVAAHASQISTFWGGQPEMERAIREFALARGGERLWLRPAQTARC